MDWWFLLFTVWPPHMGPDLLQYNAGTEAKCLAMIERNEPKFEEVYGLYWTMECEARPRVKEGEEE